MLSVLQLSMSLTGFDDASAFFTAPVRTILRKLYVFRASFYGMVAQRLISVTQAVMELMEYASTVSREGDMFSVHPFQLILQIPRFSQRLPLPLI